LTFDLLTLKVVSESRVTLATSVPILVFLGRSVLDLGPMYATDRKSWFMQCNYTTDGLSIEKALAAWATPLGRLHRYLDHLAQLGEPT